MQRREPPDPAQPALPSPIMQTFQFLFDSFGFLSWLFAFGCILAGVAFAHASWAAGETRILSLRQEHDRLRDDLASRAASPSPESEAPSQPDRPPVTAPKPLPAASAPPTTSSVAVLTRPAASASSHLQAARTPRRNSLRNDRQLGLVFYVAPEDSDPLERLPAITPSQVRELNTLGIYKFEQIARWSETNLRSFALLLGIDPSDLEKLEWIHRAKILHGESHGSQMVLAA